MERISLNGAWRARLDPENIGLAAGWAQSAIQADCLAPVPGCIQRVAELAQAYPPQNDMLGSAARCGSRMCIFRSAA